MYPPVKNQGHYPSGYSGYNTPKRREQLADFITKDGTFLPKSVLHADLDLGMLEFVKTELHTVLNGDEIPVMDKILTIQRWGEFASDWKFVDQDENVKLPFISVIRQPEVQYGTNPSLQYTIPNRKTFHYVKVPTWDGQRKGVDLYKIPQPVPVDMVYEIKVICNRMRDLNQFNRTVLQKFTSRQAYTFVKGHYIPIILESVSDESQISDLESRRYYLQTYKLQLQGFLIDEEEFEVMPAITRAMTMLEIEEPIIRRNYDTICDSEDEGYPGAGSGCIDPGAANYNNSLQFDCSGVLGGVDYSCCCYNAGCQDPTAFNYVSGTCFSATCCYVSGCTDPLACNYSGACFDDGSCFYNPGCTNPLACNYSSGACSDDGSCCLDYGCMDPAACDYDPAACCSGDCCYIEGCTDPAACNYYSPWSAWTNNSCSGLTDTGLVTTFAQDMYTWFTVNDPTATFMDYYFSLVGYSPLTGGTAGICPGTPDTGGTWSAFYQLAYYYIWESGVPLPGPCLPSPFVGYGCYTTVNDLVGALNALGYSTITSSLTDLEINTILAVSGAGVSSMWTTCNCSGVVTYSACCDDGSCCYLTGCMDPAACDYEPQACCSGDCCYITGCMDPLACNYLSGACCGDDSCCYITGCTDPSSVNYNPDACCDVGCCYLSGCTDADACNYVSGSCFPTECCYISGCTDPYACNYVSGSCCPTDCCYITGCMDPAACDYDPTACCSGDCCYITGCTDRKACNYVSGACCPTDCCYITGCMDPAACNYLSGACCSGDCCYISGCTDPEACNYVSGACCGDDSCCYVDGCTNDTPGPNPGWNPITLDWSLCSGGISCTIPGPGCCGSTNGYLSCNYDSTACCDCNGDPVGTFNPGWSACCCSVEGCMDSDACNYNPDACCSTECCYITGCTDPFASNYVSGACCDDCSCVYTGRTGCIVSGSCNYNPFATFDCNSQPVGSNQPGWSACCCTVEGCPDPLACNYLSGACCNCNCCYTEGCTDPAACNYLSGACCDDGSCYIITGCTDPAAVDYNPAACYDCNGDPIGTFNPGWSGCCCYIGGCLDPLACNYNWGSCYDDGTCCTITGCTDPTAVNYDPDACCDDCSCEYDNDCVDPTACNYDFEACCDIGDCCYDSGCMDNYPGAWPDIYGNGSDGLPCSWPCVFGYNVYNFDPIACCSCDCCYYMGCTNPMAGNYMPLACADCNGVWIYNPSGYVTTPGWDSCCIP